MCKSQFTLEEIAYLKSLVISDFVASKTLVKSKILSDEYMERMRIEKILISLRHIFSI
jgi:hypothetical protein